MTIVSALKKLHKKMTGKDATGMTVANVVNSLSENYSGGGGSAEPFKVHFTVTEREPTYASVASVTIGEMEKLDAGWYGYADENYPTVPSIIEGTEYYFEVGSEKVPLQIIDADPDDLCVGYNVTVITDVTPSDKNKWCVYIEWKNGGVTVQTNNSELFENKTVAVLEKVSDGGTEISCDASITEIVEAIKNDENVIGEIGMGFFVLRYPVVAYSDQFGFDNKMVSFGGAFPDSGDNRTAVNSLFGLTTFQEGEEVDQWRILLGDSE